MNGRDKPLVWLHGEIKTPPFTTQARIEAGVLLRRLQWGESLGLPHSRPIPIIGEQVHELRIPDTTKTWRIFYHVAVEAIVILEVVEKKTQRTPKSVNLPATVAALSRLNGGPNMKLGRRKALEKAGWKVGSADEFLGLSPAESALVNIRLALAQTLKGRRQKLGLSQLELARKLGSSQSRVAKMEAAEPDVSLDLLVRGMLALGAKPREVGQALAVA